MAFALTNRWNTARPAPWVSKVARPAETHPPNPHPVLKDKEYQIAFFCDNFFLLGATGEITLSDIAHSDRDETPVSLED